MTVNLAHAPLEPGGHTFTGLFIASPSGTGAPRNEHEISLAKTMILFEQKGLHIEVRIDPHDSLTMRARNVLASWFMDTNCSHMLCVDDDLRWYPDSVLHMLDCQKQWVCGAYRKKSDNEEYAVILPQGKPLTVCPHCGCVEAIKANVGFALLHRSVFEQMFKAYPELKCGKNSEKKLVGRHLYGLFNTIVENGELLGEDYGFCQRWQAIGGRAWIDPTVVLTHYGVKGWTGDISKWIERREQTPIEVTDDWKHIQGWLTDEQAAVLVEEVQGMPAGGVILELGSWRGRSTALLGMAAAASDRGIRVYAVDHFEGSPDERATFHHDATLDADGVYPDFLQNLAKLGVLGRVVIPVRKAFADALEGIKDESVDLVFLDGDHAEGETLKVFLRLKAKLKPGATVVFHDYNWPGVKADLDVLHLDVAERCDMAVWRKPK
jgi:predicted O-methyltransferase YrrM